MEIMRQHNLWKYVIGDKENQREITGNTEDNARTQFMELCYFTQRNTTADNGRQRETMGDNAKTQIMEFCYFLNIFVS